MNLSRRQKRRLYSIPLGLGIGIVFCVLQALGVEARHVASRLLELVKEARPTIRIHERVDDDDQVLEEPRHVGAPPRDEVVRKRQSGVGTGQLIAVNGIGHPGHSRGCLDELLGLLLV